MNEITKAPQEELAPIAPQEELSAALSGSLMDKASMNHLIKIAKFYANSALVPAQYRGKVEDCFVACEMSARMGISPLVVFQTLHVVQGKPTWAGQACKALIDGSGKFKNSEYIMSGSLEDGSMGCCLQAVSVATGKVVRGTTITLKMANDEGWSKKSGSKWATMPEQMLKYRAAAFFARAECPEVLMGFQTAEEVEDVKGVQPLDEKVTISLEGKR